MSRLLLLLIFSFLACPLIAAEDFYQFTTQKQQQRFETLTSELRCLVCQNQTLAESNAPLANDLRDQIFHKIQLGHSNNEIIQYLVARYGQFILYRPPLNLATVSLWFAPLLLLVSGLGYLIYYIRQRSRE